MGPRGTSGTVRKLSFISRNESAHFRRTLIVIPYDQIGDATRKIQCVCEWMLLGRNLKTNLVLLLPMLSRRCWLQSGVQHVYVCTFLQTSGFKSGRNGNMAGFLGGAGRNRTDG